ncbi:MAG: hypothetical protein ABWY50_09635 [Aeromicrobium sp.]
MTRMVSGAGLVLALVALAGCGGDPAYSESKACGVDAGLVEAAVGTDTFTSSETRPLEPVGVDITSYACEATVDDEKVLTLDARFREPGDVELVRKQIEAGGDAAFEHGGGIGLVGDDGSNFVCGGVVLSLRTEEGASPEDGALQALLEGVADEAGCHEREAS